MRNVSGKSGTENHKAHFTFNIFFPKGRAVYEMKWYNTAVPDGPHMTIQNGV
jgi:hypothetical protein